MHHAQAVFAGVTARTVIDYADLRTRPEALSQGGWWAVAAHFDGPWHAWRFADIQYNDRREHGYSGPGAGPGKGPRTGGAGGAAPDPRADRPPAARAPGRPHSPGPAGPALLDRDVHHAAAAPQDGPAPRTGLPGWHGPARDAWRSSMSRTEYMDAVEHVRAQIEAGRVYQANICRVLTAEVPGRPRAAGLGQILSAGNPAPYAGLIDVPDGLRDPRGGPMPSAWVVSASPELGLQVGTGRISSGPIKGTASSPGGLSEKDRAENLMITDLVRNDLQRVCRPGTVTVTDLLRVEHHPGLVHLVSRVRGDLRDVDLNADGALGWARVLAAGLPAGSISGAPKVSALHLIAQLERAPRGPYCGQIGWIDADSQSARLAVGIRTFWWAGGRLHFGTGAGITHDSDPEREWQETELKAARLVRLASG